MGVDNSLFLLAVKRVINSGVEGNPFMSLHTTSTLERYVLDNSELPSFIGEMADQCMKKINGKENYREELVETLLMNQKISQDYGTLVDKYSDSSILSEYESGRYSVFTFLFIPEDDDTTKCEVMDFYVNLVLGDTIIVLTNVHKSWLTGDTISHELRKIPPSLNIADVINALVWAIAPMFSGKQELAPSQLIKDIREEAEKIPDKVPSDDHRRKLVDPITKMKVLVTDPVILKLMPAKWEYFMTKDASQGFKRYKKKDWEFTG